jgi:tryptophan-rich sensory protein
MGYALYLVWNKGLKKKGVTDAVAIFGVQLILNVVWSYLFFGLRNPSLALFEIIVLWGAILATTLKFGKIDRSAAYLLIPYLLWVGFASALNLSIVLLN